MLALLPLALAAPLHTATVLEVAPADDGSGRAMKAAIAAYATTMDTCLSTAAPAATGAVLRLSAGSFVVEPSGLLDAPSSACLDALAAALLPALSPAHTAAVMVDFLPRKTEVILGPPDRTLVAAAIKARISQVQQCYKAGLARNPALSGKVVVRLGLAPGGHVTTAEVASSTLGDDLTAACVANVYTNVILPDLVDAGPLVVSYPFLFAPS